ncbi:hypothetical protein KXQ82_17940 [Mucilaginibacter sp. HMF5004]|uniref:cellulose binding domain-containing protein n=1 Tax=Mucilaginibacter rivuli TaxID=2857527 RepID=UPI001C5F9F2A|nr:cellulose binding domain-containing protein [Mucilaginibacter rivuli]MBW4891612.1 hypothetical protein [Mucilaginibacter rivuli]
MRNSTFLKRCQLLLMALLFAWQAQAQTPAFPGAMGFGRFAQGPRAASTREVYIVTNLNDSGTGSFRDAVSKSGRIIVFAVGGIIKLTTDVAVASNCIIAGQTAPGDGIVLFNKGVSFTGADNTICRYLRIRLGATGNSGNDACGLAHGANIIFDHMSVSWGMDEDFSINWDNKGNAPDNITIQNSIIGQGLFRENHSAGGLIQTPDGGKVSLLQNLYISNKTRNPKVKGINEFVNNVVYDWGNGNRLDQDFNYGWAGDAYIMGGSDGVSQVNVINNYFCGGPLTPPSKTTPFSRGTGTFNIYGAGNYFDNNKNGILDGAVVPFDTVGYPGISGSAFKQQPFAYPTAYPIMTAAQAYQHVIDSVGAIFPRRDQVDNFMLDEVSSKGTKGLYVYRETDMPLANGGLGNVFSAPAALDSDADGIPDAWEDAHGLNKNSKADAVAFSTEDPRYLNIEMYVNSLVGTIPALFIKPPTALALTATSSETPTPNSSVKLTWADNSDNEDNFVVERSTNGTTYTDIFHPAANALTYTDNAGLLPNTTYYYRVKAVNATDASSYTAAVSITTPPIPSAPAVTANPNPTNGFQYAALTSGKLALKWTGSSNTVTFSVYLGTDPNTLTKQADVAYAAAPTYTTVVLNDNTTYYWRVDATNAKGVATGTVWNFRTPPVIPQGLVGYYAFDEAINAGTSQVTDSTAYANTGTIGLDADSHNVRVTGKLKNGLDFSSADPNIYVVRIPNQDQLYLDKSSFSVSFWMKAPAALLPQDNNTSAYLLCKGSITKNTTTGALGKRFDIEFKNKQIRFAIDDDNDAGGGGKDELQVNGIPFFTNNWVHVVVVRDVTNKKLLMYMNGAQVGTVAITKANSGIGEASALALGNIGELEFLAATNKPAPYKGMLDEVRIYNYVLSTSEITALSSVKNTQSIAFTAIDAKKVHDADFAPVVSATSGLPVTLSSSNTSVATIVAGKVHIVAAGTANIIAAQGGDASYYAAASVSQTLTVSKYDQTITFNTLPVRTVGDTAFNAGAITNSGLVLAYSSSDTSVAKVLNGIIQIKGAGTVLITASQAGDSTFNAAADVSQQLTVNKKEQGITFNALPVKTVGDADFNAGATVSSGLVLVYSSSDTTVAAIVNGLIHINGVGTATITASQTGNAVYNPAADVNQQLTVNKKEQTITFNALPVKIFGDSTFNAGATASSGLALVYSSSDTTVATIVNGLIHINGAGTATITASQTGNAVYNPAADVNQQLTVNKKEQGITFNALPVKTIGDADFNAGATASSGLALVYSSSDTTVATIVNGLIHIKAAGTATITASQTGNAMYNPAADVSQQLTVNKKTQTITFNALPAKTLGDADLLLSATASSGLPVTYSSSNTQVATIVNGAVHITGAGTTQITATQAGNAEYSSAFASQAYTVSGLNLVVQALDGDNGQVNNNNSKPYLKIVNNDLVAVAYNQLTLRYWFTAENFAGINTWIDYAQIGGNNIVMKYVASDLPRNGALGYIEYSFTNNTMLAPNTNSGPIQSRFANKDWANLSESDDYSYQGNPGNYTANPHITLYRNGQLIYGQEPAVIPPVTKVNVSYQSQNSGNNTISTYLAVNNTGNTSLNYADVKVRYWFTKEGTAGLNYFIDYAKLGSNLVSGKFVSLSPALTNADSYFELSFNPSAGVLSPLSNTGNVQYRLAKTDWSAFNTSNDYSYAARTSAMQENSHITVYYQGQLIYGTEPAPVSFSSFAANTALYTSAGQDNYSPAIVLPENVVLYPNPLTGKQFSLKLTADLLNKNIDLKIIDSFGRILQTNSYRSNDGVLNVLLNGQYAPGVYFVTINNQSSIRFLINR